MKSKNKANSKCKSKKEIKKQEQINLQDKINQEKLIQEYQEFISQMSEIEKQLFFMLTDR